MESSIQEPFSLSSYATSRRLQKKSQKDGKSSVYASHTATSTSSDGYVTVAAQGDGVHILDVSTMHPIVSHTLGPATSFSCPSISYCSLDGAGPVYTTYAAIASSSDLSKEEEHRTIWTWRDDSSTNLAESKKKSFLASRRANFSLYAINLTPRQMPHDLSGMYICCRQPLLILAYSNKGDISLLDADCKVLHTYNSPEQDTVLKSFCFSCESCSFLMDNTRAVSVLLLLESCSDNTRVRAFFVGEDRTLTNVGSSTIPIQDISDISCSISGYLTILSRHGSWHSFQIEVSSTLEVSPTSETINLTSLDSPSILALNSSHVLLAGITPNPDRKIALLLWDLKFSVLLASHSLAIPSGSEDKTTLSLISTSSEALLIVSPGPSEKAKSTSRSSVLVVPYAVPASSTIANAMGRASAAAPWLAHRPSTSQFDTSQETLLTEMRSAMEQGRPQNASMSFSKWEEKAKGNQSQVSFSYVFVKEVLTAVLQPEKPANLPYSSEVVRHLLERGVVTASMVQPGLLSLLRLRNDWTSILMALKKVPDLLEVEIVDSLRYIIARHRQEKSDAMQVDGITPLNADTPSLPQFLSSCVQYPCSPAALRLAIWRCLPEAEDLVCLLDVLDGWLAQWAGRDVRLMPSKKVIEKNEKGVLVAVTAAHEKGADLPSMNDIVTFTQVILDSSLLTLIQHAPAHRVLRKIGARIEPEILSIDETEQLRVPLEAFVKAQRRLLKATEEGKEPRLDWRQRSKLAHQQASAAIGLYRAELHSRPIIGNPTYSILTHYVNSFSDTAFKDASADRSGPALVTLLQEAGLSCPNCEIVPDEVQRIQYFVKLWSDTGLVDLIITTGGTGFGVRDRTPEAIAPLLEREASGIVHLLLSASLKHTPLAALSRPVAGTIKNTLVVTLPGSTKAVTENIEALLQGGVLKHAIELIKGGTGQQVHSRMGSSHQHHHHHHGHSIPQPRTNITHDPSASVSTRHRISPFPLISFEDAMDLIMTTVKPLEETVLPVTPSLAGYVLAQDVYASHDVPAIPTTNVDGYAVICDAIDANGTYTVTTPQQSKSLLPGKICRVNTGAPLPGGADAVIMVEDTRVITTDEDGEEVDIQLLAKVDKGENVRAAASDVKMGDLVLQKGECIMSPGGEIGTLAFVGCKEVRVRWKPIVGILSTGNELVDLQAPIPPNDGLSWGGIWDTNRPSLQAALQGLGYEVVDLGIVADDIPAHVNAIKKGLDNADILITTGGTSMGPTDLLKPVIERHFNGTIHFGRVTIKPGKPTTFATIPWIGGVVKPVFALPGNPSSALVTFHIFVVPALRKLGGWPESKCQLPRAKVQLQSSMNLDPRTEFHRVMIRAGEGGLKAFSTGGQRSSRVASMSGANGLVVLPQRKAGGPQRLEAGELAGTVLIGELQAV
ncbi:uncharacterized protein BT62DRAFT_1075023 [Guyanagaster necrorhizus]|uniref:MoaB/Mog domain-containing protein n=1 Tax=Guyanagaster necrorhizus TaxID=856835 RepID=A0A9P8ATP6_9AGAR|nr:uncharacterized protein BT62DRAFT_1075023 [Guyanagaster necrorhizus MCA 3950]KAG7447648.1 hypothetical protein BT62DRAFT_1075023 [Guyanagaster necrorhizus MCA 3950]